jgi:hypothetical protein
MSGHGDVVTLCYSAAELREAGANGEGKKETSVLVRSGRDRVGNLRGPGRKQKL